MKDGSTQGRSVAARSELGGVAHERVEGVEFIETVVAEATLRGQCELTYETVAAMIADDFLAGTAPRAVVAALSQLS